MSTKDQEKRGRGAANNIRRVQEALTAMGKPMTGEDIATIVSLYLEGIVHEANEYASRHEKNRFIWTQCRTTARKLQWFADTAIDGGNYMKKAGG